jgi:hypothetical protein
MFLDLTIGKREARALFKVQSTCLWPLRDDTKHGSQTRYFSSPIQVGVEGDPRLGAFDSLPRAQGIKS